MLHTTQGIVLHNVRYSDNRIISKIYSKSFGLLSGHLTVGNSPKSKLKSGIIQPLTQIEFVISHKENKEIHSITDVKCLFVYTDLASNFNKLCIAQFLNEVLYKCLKEQSANEELFHFICNTYQWLDKTVDHFSDAHIYFLFELTKYLGFYPSNNKSDSLIYFDTLEGKFTSTPKSFPLSFDKIQSELFSQLFYHSISKPKNISRTERLAILDCLLHYYKIQIPGFSELKSYGVLQEMMNEMI